MKFVIPGEPVAKGRPRLGRSGFVYTPQKTRDAEEYLRLTVGDMMRVGGHKIFIKDTPLEVELAFYVSRPKTTKRKLPCIKPDLDNYVKLALDALNGVVWHDDCQIIYLSARKIYDAEPRTEIEVNAITAGEVK